MANNKWMDLFWFAALLVAAQGLIVEPFLGPAFGNIFPIGLLGIKSLGQVILVFIAVFLAKWTQDWLKTAF